MSIYHLRMLFLLGIPCIMLNVFLISFVFNNKDVYMLCLLGTNTKYGHCAGGGQERCYKRLHGK